MTVNPQETTLNLEQNDTNKNDETTVEIKKNQRKEKIISILKDIKLFLITFIIGFLFGFILEKCKVYEPRYIRQQMIFTKWLMMKMFCSALATSMLSILILNLIAKKRYSKVFETYRDTLKSKSLLTVCSGGLILGIGMTIGGACPGMIFVQLGAGVNYSYLTLIGGILGGLIHGLLSTYLSSSSKPDPIASKAFFELKFINKINHYIIRILFIVMLAVALTLLEIFVPWAKDYQFRDVSKPFFSPTSEVWHPILAGGLLGLLQFFSILIISKSLGTSSSYSTCVSLVFPFKLLEKFPYLKKFRFGLGNYASLLFALSLFLGSLTSALSGGMFNTAAPVHPYQAILGGFCLVFGARLAGGCNTGHGLSGTAHLFIGSMFALVSMFAGGIMLGFHDRTMEFFF
ncbi:unnamed protein product [Brachionus calyciflorus]|uniref:Sulphur transport domain-containing protein n=1 Tax=Brachionus calyciflorus TaxID=104777 RepID=A0A813W5Z0_9BILA|nr:unnamed protein product [Brachionus calyciflorus]